MHTRQLWTIAAALLAASAACESKDWSATGDERDVVSGMAAAGERWINLPGSPGFLILTGDASYQVSLDGHRLSRKLPQGHQIRLLHRTFDPAAPTTLAFPKSLQARDFMTADGVFIVQFITQALEPFQREIERLGGEIYVPIPDHGLLVRMSPLTRKAVAQLAFVRAVVPFHPADKLEPGLDLVATSLNPELPPYSILVMKRGMQGIVAARIAGLGGDVEPTGVSRVVNATLDGYQLREVAHMLEVLFIGRWTQAEDDLDGVRAISGADFLETVAGYRGQGVGGEALDRGYRISHQDFQANPLILHSPDHNPGDMNHGTEVAGILFSSGASDPRARGILPGAARPIVASRFSLWGGSGTPTGAQRYSHAAELVDPAGRYRAVFQTSSWGAAQTTLYTNESVIMDEITFDLDLVVLQSQSNTGNRDSRPEAWGKNMVGVGGIQNSDTLDRSDDRWGGAASIGPAEDGRIKPDLAHFYGFIYTTDNVSDTAHVEFGGTSGATPSVAGHFGLLFQMWADGVFSGGPGKARDVFNSRPHAATARALMIHAAFQYAFSGLNHDLTRTHQGWGVPDLQKLYEVARANSWRLPILVDETAIIAPLETHRYTLNVGGTQPLKATLVYADLPGVPGARVHRINDLSLRVTSPTGVVYWGNNGLLEGNWSTPGGTSNTIDPIENVFIQNPEPGSWTIEVLADEVIQDSHVETPALDADYALVATGGTAGPNLPPAPPTSLVATAGDASVSLDWANNLEPDLASYTAYRSTTRGGPYTRIAVGVLASAYPDSTVTNGITYYYVVTAVDTAGNESENSDAASATPVDTAPATPRGLVATAGNRVVGLDWADNTEPDLASYTVKRATARGGPYSVITSATTSAYNDRPHQRHDLLSCGNGS